MKRSEINEYLQEAQALFQSRKFYLPPFAFWTAKQWQGVGPEADAIRRCKLGWDVTDFGSGDFARCGLLLFTVRNGVLGDSSTPYAEKIMISREGQRAPFHFHWSKTEDIINRGDIGRLMIEFYNSRSDGEFADTPVTLLCDGVERVIPAGGAISLAAGESVRIVPGVYHSFYAQAGQGTAMIGEVSAVNDDAADNRFYKPLPRFPAVEEDAPPVRLLCMEYPDA